MVTHTTYGTETALPRSYVPSIALSEYMQERLQYEWNQVHFAKEALLEDEEQQAKKEAAKEYQRMKTGKVRALDTVFQAMTDLTYFLETIAVNKELQSVFFNDLQDLLGLKTDSYYFAPVKREEEDKKGSKKKTSRPMPTDAFFPYYSFRGSPSLIERLLYAVLIVNQEDPRNHYRTAVPYLIQQAINTKIFNSIPKDLSSEMKEIMREDIIRATAWIRLCSGDMSRIRRLEPSRIIGFNFWYPYGHASSFEEPLARNGDEMVKTRQTH